MHSYIIHTVDIFGPLQRLAVALQERIHDPVKSVHCIQDFTKTM